MAKGKPVLTHVTYMPKKGKEKELGELVKKHWPVLHKAGLTTDEPAKIWQAHDHRTRPRLLHRALLAGSTRTRRASRTSCPR